MNSDINKMRSIHSKFCTIFVIRIDVKLMVVSVNLSLFPFNGAIYNFYEAVHFPPYKSIDISLTKQFSIKVDK